MIITLCGSSRFEDWFHLYNRVLSRAGHLVFGMSSYPSIVERMPYLLSSATSKASGEEKIQADRLHLSKINASDAILVLNAFAYIGPSTLKEIDHARLTGKSVLFIESWGKGRGIDEHCARWARRATRAYDVKEKASPIETARLGPNWGGNVHGNFDGIPILGEYASKTRERCLHMIEAFEVRLQERFEVGQEEG